MSRTPFVTFLSMYLVNKFSDLFPRWWYYSIGLPMFPSTVILTFLKKHPILRLRSGETKRSYILSCIHADLAFQGMSSIDIKFAGILNLLT